jgi:hypothetical protein
MPEKKEHDRFAALKMSGLADFRNIEEARSNVTISDQYPRKVEMLYDKGWFHMGWIEKYNYRKRLRERSEFNLDMRGVCRMSVFGATGSGKTMLIRRICDFGYGSGFYIVYMTDVKDEMKSSKKPQKRFANKLATNDMPAGMNMVVYRAMFFNEYFNEDTPRDNEPFQLKYKDLTLNDILAVLNFNTPQTVDHANVVSLHYNNVENFEKLRELVMKDEKVTNAMKTKIARRIDTIIKYRFCSREGQGNFVQDLKEGKAVIFNHTGYEDIVKGEYVNIPLVFFSVVMRLVKQAKESVLDKKRRMLMVIDEAPVFLRFDSTKEEIMRAVNQWRYLGIYVLFAGQKVELIPDWVMTQSRYVFLAHNTDLQSYILTLKYKQKYIYHPSEHKDASDVIRSLKFRRDTGEREWLMIDDLAKEEIIFFNYVSLSEHTEEMG